MISFISPDDLISHLRAEISKGERFATRFILVQGCKAWDDLIPKLIFEVDRVIRLAEFCSGTDVFPDMMRLTSHLKEEIVGCRSILLTPLAECIRLDPESADVISSLAEWPADKIRRIYVPLLAAEEFFFQEINRIFRYRAGELPEPWFLTGEGSSEVIVAPFSGGFTGRHVAQGIKEYLSLWEQGSVRKVWLVTDMARWLPVRQARSECRVRLYPSSFDYVCKNVGWEELREDWGSPQQWEWLAVHVQEGDDFDRLAGRLLNFGDYNADQLFALWGGLDNNKRWIVWLWSKKQSKPDTYLYHVLKNNNHVDGFNRDTSMAIFDLPRSVSISRERKNLLQRLGINLMPAEFWERYSELTDPLDRVAVLTDLSAAEREHLLLGARELLTQYSYNFWWEYLEVAFPGLTWYLQPAVTGDAFTDQYFSVYNRSRLKDQADEELVTLIGKWASQQLLWDYPPRSDILATQRAAGAKVLWVDAMGVEWTGLLTQLLTQNNQVDCKVSVARGYLPTTTEANKEWEADENVERGLDDIAHHYAYQFPHSFLKAIEVMEDVAHKALALLSQHSAVVITSDHGLSRFAVTTYVQVNAPEGAMAEAPGRYAILPEDGYGGENNESWVIDKRNAVLLNHSRFKGGGHCRGEVHGGATPEEYLVPVIIVQKSAGAPPRFEVITEIIRLNTQGEGVLTIRCNRKAENVQLRVDGYALTGQSGAKFTWSFSLQGWKAGKYTGKLYSANRFVGDISFEVIKGLIQDDLGL
ncbi:MAG: BREX-4 system phosphatase PglZ [Ammonifex sp.]|jgi:hypothetical protein|nr:MAG: BREX-4 system phosphatase PglZ [Ammonifex sp.]